MGALAWGAAAAAVQVQGLQRAGHGIETGGEDDDVRLVHVVPDADPGLGDAGDRRLADVDEVYVVPVEGLVVVVAERRPLAHERVVRRTQELGGLGIFLAKAVAELERDQQAAFAKDPAAAKKLLAVGEAKADPKRELPEPTPPKFTDAGPPPAGTRTKLLEMGPEKFCEWVRKHAKQ